MDETTLMLGDSERVARLRLIRAATIGPATFWPLIERYGSARRAIEALPTLARKSPKTRPLAPLQADVEREIESPNATARASSRTANRTIPPRSLNSKRRRRSSP